MCILTAWVKTSHSMCLCSAHSYHLHAIHDVCFSVPHPWGPGTPRSSALRNPHPKSPCEGEERRAGLGQALPTGSPIVGPSWALYTAMRRTSLHPSGADTYVPNAVLSAPPRPANTAPLHRASIAPCFTELVVSLKKTTIDSPCMELVVSLKTTVESTCLWCSSPRLPRLPVNVQVDAAWEGTGNESSVTKDIYGRERCDGTDEDGFLASGMMIKV